LISGFRWSFYGASDISIGVSLGITLGIFAIALVVIAWIFKTGYRLKS
jgi:ABC-2 type transport system permease protein